MIHEIYTKEINPVILFGYLILISIDFYVFSLVLVSIVKIYQTLKTAFDHISKHLEVCQEDSSTRRIFNSVLGVWKCAQTRPFVLGLKTKFDTEWTRKKVHNE